MNVPTDVTIHERSAQVPAAAPAGESPTAPVRPVHWLVAPLVALLVPFRPHAMGGHLAASGWRAAAVVGALAALATWLAALPLLVMDGRSPTAVTPETAAQTLIVLQVAAPHDWVRLGAWLLAGAAVVLPLAAALLLMPLLAAGERARRLFGRALRLAAWSWVVMPPVLVAAAYAGVTVGTLTLSEDPSAARNAATTAVVLLGLLFWLRTFLRLGERYAGPPDGPGFEPREVRCTDCGYRLRHLPLTGRCPECGRPIADSLPEQRRMPFGTGRADGWLGTLRATWRLLRDRNPGRWLAVHRDRPAARRLALRVCLLLSLPAGTILWPVAGELLNTTQDSVGWRAAWCVSCAAVALLLLSVLAIVAWVASWGGWRDAARRGVVVCYAAPKLVSPVLVSSVSTMVILIVVSVTDGPDRLVPALAIAVAAGFLWWRWLAHVRRMLRATRYASA